MTSRDVQFPRISEQWTLELFVAFFSQETDPNEPIHDPFRLGTGFARA